ncbi:hypothetical protein HZF08_26710 [Paenibacillus sp. CGMCC 1.16610]|uniref:Uncharacterized protein n=1 Tax=Paenibacillus anseongense TaxID=2682845 RepID=A0ABW9U4S4_9BACL|nr:MULTISPECIES: hypothetical protein [Paenibacillus]MBA2941884.1 hypothetical protein [Paenibacillus sp. CGMCC 1.16610]MVQ34402.1 hypothetical protein [Paenibacillus anseongense]
MFNLKKSLPILAIVATVSLASTAYAATQNTNLSYLNASANGYLNATFKTFSNDEATAKTEWIGATSEPYLVVAVDLQSADNIASSYTSLGTDYGNSANVYRSKGGVWAFKSVHKILDRYALATERHMKELTDH